MGVRMEHVVYQARRYWSSLAALVLVCTVALAVAGVAQFPRQAAHAATGDWPTFLGGNARTGFNSAETAITATTGSNLKVHWTYPTKGHVTAEPTVVNGQIYWGSWDGNEYATDLTGKKIWSAPIGGQTKNCNGS